LAAAGVRPLVLRALGSIDPGAGRLFVVGAGKASGAMAAAVEEAWPGRGARGGGAGEGGGGAPPPPDPLRPPGPPPPPPPARPARSSTWRRRRARPTSCSR